MIFLILLFMFPLTAQAPLKESVDEPTDPLTLVAPLFPLNHSFELAGLQNPELEESFAEKRVQENKKAVQSRAFPWKGVLYLILAVGAAFLLKKRELFGLRSSVIQKSADEARQEALTELSTLPSIKDSKLELTTLDKVVREYLEDAHHIDASHNTSEELIEGLFEAKVGRKEDVQEIANLYREIDVGKYSPQAINPQKTKQLVTIASKIITQLGTSK